MQVRRKCTKNRTKKMPKFRYAPWQMNSELKRSIKISYKLNKLHTQY